MKSLRASLRSSASRWPNRLQILAGCALPALLLAPTFASADEPRAATVIDATYGADRLDAQYGNWKDIGLRVTRENGSGSDVHLAAGTLQRFGLTDQIFGGGFVARLTPRSSFSVDTAFSGTHRVAASSNVRIDYESVARSGYGGAIAIDRRLYSQTGVTLIAGTLERYAGNGRLALVLTAARLDGASTGLGARVSAAHYFAGDARLQIDVGGGREIESIAGVPRELSTFTASVNGVQPLSRAWSALLGIDYGREGMLYQRAGIRLGIRHRA